jgi:DNA-binding NtrC family response regulator
MRWAHLPMKNSIAKKRILSISYDESLLATRQMILEQAGYEVTSALGFAESLERSKQGPFDLVVLGHSLPLKDKSAIVAALKGKDKPKILSIRRHGYAPIPEADASVEAIEGPQAMLEAVRETLD